MKWIKCSKRRENTLVFVITNIIHQLVKSSVIDQYCRCVYRPVSHTLSGHLVPTDGDKKLTSDHGSASRALWGGIQRWPVESPYKPVTGRFLSQKAGNADLWWVYQPVFFKVTWEMETRRWSSHNMESISALLAICVGNPMVMNGFPAPMASNPELWLICRPL